MARRSIAAAASVCRPPMGDALRHRAVLFDLDGTLLDTIEDLAAAMNAALSACGLPGRPEVAEHKRYVGDGVAKYVERTVPESARGDAELLARVTRRYRAAYADGWKKLTRPYDGIGELLDELARRSVRCAVLSNKPDDTTRLTTEEFLGAGRFDVIRGATDGVPLKPDPAAAIAVAAEMGLEPGQFAYVGDTATDMATAKAAGMFAIGALWGFRGADELRAAGAEALAAAPADVLKLI